jgi:hypothetical protein
MVGSPGGLLEERRGFVLIIDGHLHDTIVIDIAERGAARRVQLQERRAGCSRYIFESTLTGIAVENHRVLVADRRR